MSPNFSNTYHRIETCPQFIKPPKKEEKQGLQNSNTTNSQLQCSSQHRNSTRSLTYTQFHFPLIQNNH